MDSNAVVLDLLHYNIISKGDQKTITMNMDQTQQNKFLHLYLNEKCTRDTFLLVCDIISDVKGNPKMRALGTAMRRRLETGVCVCVCVHAHVFVCALLYLKVYIHMLVNSCDWCGSVVRCCSTPSRADAAHITSSIFTVCKEIDHADQITLCRRHRQSRCHC